MIDESLTLPCGIVLPNRLAKASLSESLAVRGQPTPAMEALYARWSEGGIGLSLTGNVMIQRRYRERMANVVIDAETDMAALTRYARACKAAGNIAAVQINHPGRQVNRFVANDPVGPSDGPAVSMLGFFARPRALTLPEIESLIEGYVQAALQCEQAGFDGVLVHAAHGYLISQFLSPLSNKRTDDFGGPIEKRAAFLFEILTRIRARTRKGFGLFVKLNSADFQRGGFSEEDSLQVVRMLDAFGVDLLEISGGNYESLAFLNEAEPPRASTRAREAFFMDYARKARARTKLPLMLTGGFRTREVMESALREGAVDVIGLGRPLILDPDFPKKLLSGEVTKAMLPPRIHTPITALQGAAETGFYVRNMHRLACGEAPQLSMNGTACALWYVWHDALRGTRRAFGAKE